MSRLKYSPLTLRKTESRHISNYSFTSPLDLSRRVAIRRRLIESKRQTEQSQETQVINTSQSIRNTVSTTSRPINNDENNSLISNFEGSNKIVIITSLLYKYCYYQIQYIIQGEIMNIAILGATGKFGRKFRNYIIYNIEY